ncbi:DUF2391 family protein [Natronomonas sp. EA1]|uniref:DUF2391 family protein n=1 Tax=Natronomonas sp. EA1 TaxID=3421655 RepID=UPI003EB75D14
MSDAPEAPTPEADGDPDRVEPTRVVEELTALKGEIDDPEVKARLKETIALAAELQSPGFGNVIYGFDRADATEMFLGAVLFGIPMFVEGGTGEVGAFVATHPAYLLGTLVGAIALVVGIIYVADFQDVRVTNPVLGLVPRRVVGVITIPFLTALVVMTAWGRVDWADPWVALCTVTVAFVPMSIGAALGDILPGS